MGRELLSLEDPLTYLPRKPVQEFAKRRVIYSPEQPSYSLYVVILGRVKVTNTADDGVETIGRIVCSEGLFGESALVGTSARSESAVAIDNVSVMSWTRQEIEQQIEREPHLGIALSQHLVRQCMELQERIESMAVYKTPERVMLSLVQLASTLGTPMPDGSTHVGSLTHHTIADYVGTSREIVTFQMNRLRRLGLLRYSRKGIEVYTQAMQDVLRGQGINATRVNGGAARRMAV
ncbi:Transcriptional regulator, Crp/Fnr family [Candidatus Sulfopaludibacter sp. SbA4]|nr:Transcriptional regulator, Crp/Fnr family [Candidatus Sulfopaludibacter sp. SbA4]